jgi:hypothetical protein
MATQKFPYTKNMIELIHAIRPKMPKELRAGVRFSNPDILINMAKFYHQTRDITAKLMIEELLTEVGEETGKDWLKLLEKKDYKKNLNESIRNKTPRLLLVNPESRDSKEPYIETKKRWGKTITKMTV